MYWYIKVLNYACWLNRACAMGIDIAVYSKPRCINYRDKKSLIYLVMIFSSSSFSDLAAELNGLVLSQGVLHHIVGPPAVGQEVPLVDVLHDPLLHWVAGHGVAGDP